MEKNDREIQTWMVPSSMVSWTLKAPRCFWKPCSKTLPFERSAPFRLPTKGRPRRDPTPDHCLPEQANMVVNFWHAVESEAQENHDEEFLQERAYLLAQNVLQGRMRREALDAVAKRDPACVREAAKIIGHMESVRSDLEHQASAEPLDELRHQTMTQLFGTDANAQVSAGAHKSCSKATCRFKRPP